MVSAKEEGYIKSINAEKVGKLSVYLGAGRLKKEETIDSSVGFVFNKKVGDKVEIGDNLVYIHANDEEKCEKALKELEEIIEITKNEISKQEHILGIIE